MFAGAATGAPMPTLAWQRSNDGGATWAAIAGATSSTYTLAAASLDDNNARFRLSATNGGGTANSDAASLTVTATAGQNTQIMLPAGSGPTGTTLGPDGNIWFTN
jgi:streptogramin lyase